jgi:hypothetical protein
MSVRWTRELVDWIREQGPHMTRAEMTMRLGCSIKALYTASHTHGFRFRRPERYITVDRVQRLKPNCTLSDELLREIEMARREAPTAPPYRGRVGV